MSYTPISKMTDDLNVISGLPNRPSDSGYTAPTLKAAFDEAANAIKNYINGHTVDNEYVNGLVDELNAKLSTLEGEVSDFKDLQFPDGVIKTDMIYDLQVTNAKLSADAVTREKILNGEVVQGKLGSKAVQTGNIDDGAVDTDQLASGAVTYAKTFGIQKQTDIISPITIPASAWVLYSGTGWVAQVARDDTTGYTDINRMFFYPVPGNPSSFADYKAFLSNKVYCTTVTSNYFNFVAESRPEANIALQCLIIY